MTPRRAGPATAPERLPRLAGLPAPGLPAMTTETRVRVLEGCCLRRERGRRPGVPPAHRVRGDRPPRRQGLHPLPASQLERALEAEADLPYEGTAGQVAAAPAAEPGGGPAARGGGSP
jgi:hypothetical protein